MMVKKAGQRIGYVRVSTLDQNADRQLEDVAVDRTFLDKKSGKDVGRERFLESCKQCINNTHVS